jgi:hypothetical protein
VGKISKPCFYRFGGVLGEDFEFIQGRNAATFVNKGSHIGQEVRNDLFFVFGPFQNLAGAY